MLASLLDSLHALVDVLIPAAYAQAGAPQPNPIITFLPLIVAVPVIYFLMIRPQQKRAKEMREMLGKLAKGDEVIITGGLAGRVAVIGEAYLTLEIADNVLVKVQKGAVASVLPKGTLKNL
ncbi:MAG: yajC [Nevskia sp.]|nr:yajC [Nevskia sp.]